jgi:hypothetical protein
MGPIIRISGFAISPFSFKTISRLYIQFTAIGQNKGLQPLVLLGMRKTLRTPCPFMY